jgi:phage tail-like protein
MDANGQGFWMLASAEDWPWRQDLRWDPRERVLRLVSRRRLESVADRSAAAEANAALERVPRACDCHGGVAWWDAERGVVCCSSEGEADIDLLALSQAPRDLVVGHDGVLYLLLEVGIRLHDLRGRWRDVTVAAEGFSPWRAAAHPDGGLWVLERSSGRLARLSGLPMAMEAGVRYASTVFRPDPENGRAPQIRLLEADPWSAGERAVALAGHREAGLAVLCWRGAGESWLHRFDTEGRVLGEPLALPEARHAYDLDWVDEDRLVVRLPGLREAPALMLSNAEGDRLPICGEIYPLPVNALAAPFVRHPEGPPRVPIPFAARQPGLDPGLVSLHRLSVRNLARHGEARHHSDASPRPLDSGQVDTVWHRLHAEARLPERTGMVVWLAATSERIPPPADALEHWLPHYFGERPSEREPLAPRAVYDGLPSELPFHPGLGPWRREKGVAGLWSVLIQNPRRSVRRLVGRYLWIRLEMVGDGHATPELAALRVWASRFSYRDRYLPRLYREARFGAAAEASGAEIAALEVSPIALEDLNQGLTPEILRSEALRASGLSLPDVPRVIPLSPGRHWILADSNGPGAWHLWAAERDGKPHLRVNRAEASGPDFLERFLASFEGLLTTLEDRIASAHLLSDPHAIPEEHLNWLAGWIGVGFDPALPPSRRRDWLASAPKIARLHGTRAGLELALEVATGGGVSGGEVVVVEDFRLRRLLATLLGVDRAEESDPLLAGLVVSGNSVVGDTLVLGEHETEELRQLFLDRGRTAQGALAMRSFQAQLAHRATVLVHQSLTPTDLGLVERIVELERPAHTIVQVKTATWPLLVGIGSLVGVDTYLGPERKQQPVQLNRSQLGDGDRLIAPAALHPSTIGGRAPPPLRRPVADAGPDQTVASGQSFRLDGRGSTADEGHHIQTYLWRWVPPDS